MKNFKIHFKFEIYETPSSKNIINFYPLFAKTPNIHILKHTNKKYPQILKHQKSIKTPEKTKWVLRKHTD